ncbi:MAG: hypothetical protein QOJ86_4194 [Bradyrhizobium sp.]|nr:hypothetical protein [Bradyrhizobium sp.]
MVVHLLVPPKIKWHNATHTSVGHPRLEDDESLTLHFVPWWRTLLAYASKRKGMGENNRDISSRQQY